MDAFFLQSRRTVLLAVPIISGHVGQMLMSWVDTVMIGHLGVVPLSACALSNMLLMVPFVLCFGILSSVSIRASLAFGADDEPGAVRALHAGLGIAGVLGAAVFLLAVILLPGLGLLGQPPAVVDALPGYFILCAISAVPALTGASAKSFAESLARPWIPFWIVIASVGLNAVLNWLLIFGNLGFPQMGLEGAGWGTLLARLACGVGLITYALSLRQNDSTRSASAGLAREIRAQLRLGLPVGGMYLAEISGFSFGSLMMGWIGVDALAAHQIALTCAGTTFMVPLGLSQAVCVRVGHSRGRGLPDDCRLIAWGGLLMAVCIMGVFGGTFLLFGGALARIFTPDPQLIALASGLLAVAGFFQVFDGVQVVASGILRGFEDVRFPMIFGAVSYWLVGIPTGSLLAFSLGLGATGIWIGFSIALFLAAVGLTLRVAWRLNASVSIRAAGSGTNS